MTQMTAPWLAFVQSFSFVAVGSCPVSGQPSPPSIYQRPTVVNARIGGSPRLRDGSYNATGVSGVCGLIPKEASLTGEAMFVVEFRSDAPSGSITSIAFGSNQLVSGNATATAFRLSVGVVTSAGGWPPLYVLNTDAPRSRSSGTATLATTGGETTLTVKGLDEWMKPSSSRWSAHSVAPASDTCLPYDSSQIRPCASTNQGQSYPRSDARALNS